VCIGASERFLQLRLFFSELWHSRPRVKFHDMLYEAFSVHYLQLIG
jgi:hypothetical protein